MNVTAQILSSPVISTTMRSGRAVLSLPIVHASRALSSSKISTPTILSNQSINPKDFFRKIALKIPYFERHVMRSELTTMAQLLYVCTLHYIDFEKFTNAFGLDDSFASWTDVVQLHAWMLMVRLNNHQLTQDNRVFSFLRTEFNKSMWQDIEKRAKKISNNVNYKAGLCSLGDQYITASLDYNDGWAGTHQQFKDALRKHALSSNKSVEPSQLDRLLDYTSKNLTHLQEVTDGALLKGYVTFIPIHRDRSDPVMDKQILDHIRELDH